MIPLWIIGKGPIIYLIAFACLQVGAFSVLKELVVVLPDCLADHIGSLIPGIEKALSVSIFSAVETVIETYLVFSLMLNYPSFQYFLSLFIFQDKSSTSNLKIEALIFTRLVLASHSPPVFHPHIEVLAVTLILFYC